MFFECSSCKEKTDNPDEYIYPMSECANLYEPNPDFWVCKECHAQDIHEKQVMKAEDNDY